jgi:hypothetical protein
MHGTRARFPTLLMATKSCSREVTRRLIEIKTNVVNKHMIRIYHLEERLVDIELIDEKIVYSRPVNKNIIAGVEETRNGRSDSEFYHRLPEIFDGQVWADHVSVDETPGPDDIIEEPPSQSDLSDDELEAIQHSVEQEIAKDGLPSDADLMEEIEKMNDTAPK